MGYEEVETVLPANFVTRADPVPVPAAPVTETAAGATRESRRSRSGRTSIMGMLRTRSKSRTRKSKTEHDTAVEGSSPRGRNSTTPEGRSWSRSRSKSRSSSESRTRKATPTSTTSTSNSKSKNSLVRFRSIKKADSNATVVRSNTTKSKKLEKMRQQPEVAEQREEVSAIQSADQSPIAREIRSSPATVSSTDNSRTSDEKAESTTTTTTTTTAVEDVNYESLPIEVGDEDQQFEVQLEHLAKDEEASPLALQSAPSKDLSVGAASARSTRSIKSFLSNKSNKSNSSNKSNKHDTASVTSNKSVKSAKSIGSKAELKASSSKDAASVCSARSAKSTTSNKSVKSTKSISSKTELKATEGIAIENGSTPVNTDESTRKKEISKDLVVGEDGTSKTSTALAIKAPSTVAKVDPAKALTVEDGSNSGTWVKKVSLSFGGYKTSFQLTDPITGLTNAIRDALDVVGNDDALTQQAKTIDSINANDDDAEEERDYETNPTQLFVNIQQRAWAAAMMQLQNCPEEAKVWVYLKAKSEKAPNAPDAEENKEALVVQHSSLVVHDGNDATKLRWKLLPLHAAIVLGAPSEVTEAILKAYPNAAKKRDERGSLPVHLAASRLDVDSEGEKIVLQLFGTFPDSIDFLDSKGRSPTELATLARARKEIAEQRKMNACNSKTVQLVESEVNQKEDGVEAGETGEIDDDDDDKSVMSNISGRFKQMIRRSKSSDTAVRRRKKKSNKGGKVDAGLSPSKSVDNDCDDDTVAILPGFAFLTTSKSQEMRDRAAPAEIAKDEETEKTEEELLVAAKKELLVAAKQAIISKEYQTPAESPREVTSPKDIPLPKSFSMGDECSVATVANQTSSRKESSDTAAPTVQTIEEECNIAEEESTQETTSTASTEVNEGLQVLLEKAAENAGRVGLDVTEYVKILADEWVTDVEALRRLDSDTLDDLLPLMLSRELHKMIHQADGVDTKFLQEEGNLERGRSPKKSVKKSKKKRSHRRASKRTHHQPITPPEGPLSPISEIGENSASVSFGEVQPVIGLEEPMEEEEGADADEEEVRAEGEEEAEEEEDAEINQTTSVDDDLEIRKLHANLIAEARTKFPTREELEDAIRERHNEVKVAINSGFNVDKEAIARAALADDEMRKLLPLRLILPTAADLHEMVTALQMHKEGAIREFDMEKARMIQSEIDELQDQLDLEKKYIRTKHEGEIKCAGCGEYFPIETKMAGILKRTEKFCQECRGSED
ncbi:hypothetical protein ACHAWU_010388 [Discostella pseudostelligera]|uniref:Uncharacterized protein n=1 Tax=Discostella pseudostelligera TaxID=259834 RepID=A0ABD3MNZ0_9STRA